MAKKAAIVQSNYIPWKGYFDLIASVDEFILFDDMQYTKRDWRNRNKIKTPRGPAWLTIPVESKGKYLQKIRDTKVADPEWGKKHWRRIGDNYAKARFFKDYEEALAPLFFTGADYLSEINRAFIATLCALLGIRTRITDAGDYPPFEGKSARLAELCLRAGADEYLSGPSARDYLDESVFSERGIRVSYIDYSGYPEYRQLFPPFDHRVSVLDLLFNEGPEARRFMKAS